MQDRTSRRRLKGEVNRIVVTYSKWGTQHAVCFGLGFVTVLQFSWQAKTMGQEDARGGFVCLAIIISVAQSIVSGLAFASTLCRCPPSLIVLLDRHFRLATCLKYLALWIKLDILAMPFVSQEISDVDFYVQCRVNSFCPASCTDAMNGVCTVSEGNQQCLCVGFTAQKEMTVINCALTAVVLLGVGGFGVVGYWKNQNFRTQASPFCGRRISLVAFTILYVAPSLLQMLLIHVLTVAKVNCLSQTHTALILVPSLFVGLLGNEVMWALTCWLPEAEQSFAALRDQTGILWLRPLSALSAGVASVMCVRLARDTGDSECSTMWMRRTQAISAVLLALCSICSLLVSPKAHMAPRAPLNDPLSASNVTAELSFPMSPPVSYITQPAELAPVTEEHPRDTRRGVRFDLSGP